MVSIKYASTEDEVAQIYTLIRGVRDIKIFLGGSLDPARARSAAETKSLLVAKESDIVVGFMYFHLRKDGGATVYDIAVHPDYRRKGIASMLLHVLPSNVRIKVMDSNANMKLFLRAHGFRKMSCEKYLTANGGKIIAVYEK